MMSRTSRKTALVHAPLDAHHDLAQFRNQAGPQLAAGEVQVPDQSWPLPVRGEGRQESFHISTQQPGPLQIDHHEKGWLEDNQKRFEGRQS